MRACRFSNLAMNMWLSGLVVLLHTACVLRAHSLSYKSTGVEDALFQQENHLKAETAGHLRSNTTVVDEDEYNALAQLDQLSLVTRYTGLGYDILKGNPEGDFNRGGIDPGIKTTRQIFAHTYQDGREAFYLGESMKVPDQVIFYMAQSCASSHSVKAYSGRKSYMKELETSVSVGGSFSAFASVSFSLSAGMAKVESQTEKQKRIIIQKNKICNSGRARYLYENAVARESRYTLSRSFQNSVKFQLPSNYIKKPYMQFIKNWGTHIIMTVDVGTREIERSSSTYTEVHKYITDKNQFSASAGGGHGGFSANAGFSIKNINENINEKTNLGKKVTKFTIGSLDIPLPVHLDLSLITKSLDEIWWGGAGKWREHNIDKKQKNLMRALKEYPSYVHAKKNTDPIITINVQWPSGAYALPKAKWGCPKGWHKGYRVQHTQNGHNKISNPKIDVGIEHYKVRFWYCVKKSPRNNDIPWPRGTYCIARKGGHCPSGFKQGGIWWDDHNRHNKNWRWGELPDGKFDHDTVVDYCCRSDGNHNTPMTLPTDKPFVLYRYGGRCQRVEGMIGTWDYINWNVKKSNCWGTHPDASCQRNLVLRLCYYAKKK